MSGQPAENMVIASLDQDWAQCVEVYDRLTPTERGELALWLTEPRLNLRKAPLLIRRQITALASVAFLETALRWRQREDTTDQS